MKPLPRWGHNDLDGMFESPHNAPPKWLRILTPLYMYTAYLDETGQQGYLWSLFPLVLNIIKYIPADERVELIFGAQAEYKERTLDLLALMAKTIVEDPIYLTSRTPSGLSTLAKWGFVPPESTILLDPSDYYAYALAHYHQDPTSQRTEWCTPILDAEHGMPYIGRILSRDEIRGQITRGIEKLLLEGIPLQGIPLR